MARKLCLFSCCLILVPLAACGQRTARDVASVEENKPQRPRSANPEESGPLAETDLLTKRKERWHRILEERPFQFREAAASASYSLAQQRLEPKIRTDGDLEDRFKGITFEVVREGKVVLTIHGDSASVFRVADGILYFSHFSPFSTGCSVAAHDMTTGKERWKTELTGLGPISHLKYSNQMTMEFGGKEDPEALVLTGQESAGNYVEVLDQKTGRMLAHKVYPRWPR
jgi:hypothetical protein